MLLTKYNYIKAFALSESTYWNNLFESKLMLQKLVQIAVV